jgi:phenylpyruvate tautomerase PptA (4-oxalocrotonate tautomerase family)
MPILDVQLVLPAGERLAAGLAQAVADAAGARLGAEPGRVWVRLEVLASTNYAENNTQLAASDLPVFVRVLHAQPPVGTAAETEILALTAAIGAALGRPAHRVHIEYAPAGKGRMAFGGRMVQ